LKASAAIALIMLNTDNPIDQNNDWKIGAVEMTKSVLLLGTKGSNDS
jgi:hypothetical protein